MLPGLADAQSGEPYLIVPDSSDQAESERARGKVQLVTGVEIPPERTRGLDDLVAETGYTALTSEGVELFTCKGPALDAAGFDARLGAAVRLVDELDLEAASEALRALEADLPCSVSAVPARQLHDLFFFSGLMAAYDEERDQAIARFARAAALKPDVTWNESYGPTAQQLFLLGKEQALTAEPVTLTVVPPTDAQRMWIDGRQTDDAGPTVADLRAGTHVVHVETGSGAIRAVGLDLPGGPALYADPRAAAQAVESGVMEGPAAEAAAGLLALAGAAWETPTLFTWTRRGALRWTAAGGLERPQRPLTPVGDRLGVRLGAGVLVREAPFRKPFAYAAPALEIDVGLIRGLEATVFARVGLASFSEGTLSVVPVWGAGLQWAFAGVMLKPFAGAQAVFVAKRATDVAGLSREVVVAGGVARFGAILSPIPRNPLRLALGVSFGWVDGIHASATVSVGFGVRPKGAKAMDDAPVQEPADASSPQ